MNTSAVDFPRWRSVGDTLRVFALLAGPALAMAGTPPEPPPPVPEVYELVPLGPDYQGLAMNDAGEVLLTDAINVAFDEPFDVQRSIWRDANRDGVIDNDELEPVCRWRRTFSTPQNDFPPDMFLSGCSNSGLGGLLNNLGQVVLVDWEESRVVLSCTPLPGRTCAMRTDRFVKAFFWNRGSVTLIDDVADTQGGGNGDMVQNTQISDLNDLGTFVGQTLRLSPFGSEPFLWDGALQRQPELRNIFGALRINNLGQIAAQTDLIQPSGTIVPFGGVIYDLNNLGDLVLTDDMDRRGLNVWLEDGTIYDLTPALVERGQEFAPSAYAFNDRRQLVFVTPDENQDRKVINLFQDDNQNGQVDPEEIYDLRLRLPDPLPFEFVRRIRKLNNRGQMLLDTSTGDYLMRPQQPWLMMVVLALDDTLQFDAARQAARVQVLLNDLEAAAMNPAVKVVALVDGPEPNDSFYYLIQPDDSDELLANYEDGVNRFPLGEADLAQAGTLTEFVRWARNRAPAASELLVLEGAGGVGGLLVDDTSEFEPPFMSMSQFQAAMADIGSDGPVDALYLKTPFQAMLEVGFSAAPGARYLIASQEYIWRFPAIYRRIGERLTGVGATERLEDTLLALTQAISAERSIVLGGETLIPVTTSLVNLNKLQPALDLANLTALALNTNLPLYRPALEATLDIVQRFDTSGDSQHTKEDDLIDLFVFVGLLRGFAEQLLDIDPATDPLLSSDITEAEFRAGTEYVVGAFQSEDETSVGTDVSFALGVSIFFPSDAKRFYDGANYSFAAGTVWNSGPGNKGLAPSGPPLYEPPAWGQFIADYVALTNPDAPGVDDLPRPDVAQPVPIDITPNRIFGNGFESAAAP
ncbi:MAG: hypothetical protein AAF358_23385 [Pseudomonadota bacterium]